ncbi:MAG TPA: bifunctional 3-phenylpropionate/cinnamic acid dioxygenase ferredoxin subunit [Acidimicrobiia bacterium]|jgi:3-phenylpropionate/trans-cinnamate dioxygenase ferredoxin subunit
MKLAIADFDSLPRENGVRVVIGEHRIAMFRVGDEVFAIGDTCSHAEASLSEGEVFDGAVECPRHGSEFDLRTGKATTLPATTPVPTYEVSVEDGTVYLTLEEEAE